MVEIEIVEFQLDLLEFRLVFAQFFPQQFGLGLDGIFF